MKSTTVQKLLCYIWWSTLWHSSAIGGSWVWFRAQQATNASFTCTEGRWLWATAAREWRGSEEEKTLAWVQCAESCWALIGKPVKHSGCAHLSKNKKREPSADDSVTVVHMSGSIRVAISWTIFWTSGSFYLITPPEWCRASQWNMGQLFTRKIESGVPKQVPKTHNWVKPIFNNKSSSVIIQNSVGRVICRISQLFHVMKRFLFSSKVCRSKLHEHSTV